MIYTIGYAGVTLEKFIELLKEQDISVLIDVRSLPKSRYFYQFNDANLSKSLAKEGIEYIHMKNEFGARQENPDFYTNEIFDYDKFAESFQFQNGVGKVLKLTSLGKNICLMCSEIDPVKCHRAILCARHLAESGENICHIIAKRNGDVFVEPQEEFETRLLQETKINNISEAYRKQNKKIGYKLTNL